MDLQVPKNVGKRVGCLRSDTIKFIGFGRLVDEKL